jgi:hypothetical protein
LIRHSRESCSYEILEKISFQSDPLRNRFHNFIFYSSRTLACWFSDI